LPIMITENGICTSDDALRWEFIEGHLRHIHKAMEQGVPVTGYLYWSLLDNFEWDKGSKYRFGLLNVDYQTMEKKIRKFAFTYAKICKDNALESP